MPEPAAFAWLIIILTLVGFEGWATLTHHQTMSQWLWHWMATYRWVRPVGIGSLLFLIKHFFF